MAHCYGCGRLNEHGHQIKSFWDGDETVSNFTPKEYHTAIPGYVYGGLIASLIDCHGTGTAALAAYRAENRDPNSLPPFRFVTASLQVDYLKPTPLGVELEVERKSTRDKREESYFRNFSFSKWRNYCTRQSCGNTNAGENVVCRKPWLTNETAIIIYLILNRK
ncbi:MAG: PaaI family thioesterase [Ignavibacteriales bacterium]|nr:PaaI family thioesterase [Ignavibacteriales bacterium]